MSGNVKHKVDNSLLLTKFNNRESIAYGEVYALFYDELLHFSKKLYKDTEVEPSDVIHDIFVTIWESKKLKFPDLFDIKAYIYASIKNNFRNYLTHKKCTDKYKQSIINDSDHFVVEVAESEVYSLVKQAINLLPQDCAEVMKYLLEGWEIKDIAIQLNRPERTIYNKKAEAIKLIKSKLPKKIFTILITLIN